MKPRFDIVYIGHIAKDRNVILGQERIEPGGAVYYGAVAMRAFGLKVAVVTRCELSDRFLLDPLKQAGIDCFVQDSPVTTGMENVYLTADQERRQSRVLAFAGPFDRAQFPDIDATVWLTGSLTYGELDLDDLIWLKNRGQIGVDIQGFTRHRDGDRLVHRDWPERRSGFALIDYLKTDHAELEVLTGESELESGIRKLSRETPAEILVTHTAGVMVYDRDKIYRARWAYRSLEGRTGRGDTTVSAYIAARLSQSAEDALHTAAALTSLKMEKHGPFRGKLDDVKARIVETAW